MFFFLILFILEQLVEVPLQVGDQKRIRWLADQYRSAKFTYIKRLAEVEVGGDIQSYWGRWCLSFDLRKLASYSVEDFELKERPSEGAVAKVGLSVRNTAGIGGRENMEQARGKQWYW